MMVESWVADVVDVNFVKIWKNGMTTMRAIVECLLQQDDVVDDDAEVSTDSDDGEHARQRWQLSSACYLQQKIEHEIFNFIVILKHEI